MINLQYHCLKSIVLSPLTEATERAQRLFILSEAGGTIALKTWMMSES